jgi:hypothetical protein
MREWKRGMTTAASVLDRRSCHAAYGLSEYRRRHFFWKMVLVNQEAKRKD